MTQPIKKQWPSATIALCCSFIIVALLITLLLINIRNTQAERGLQVLATVDAIADETDAVLEQLDAANFERCSSDNLKLMRQHLFLSIFIKDIGFYQNGKLVCTTGTGVLPEPIDEAPPDYIGIKGFRIYISHPLLLFDPPRYASMVAYRRYNVVVDLSSIAQLDFSPFDWEATHTINNNTTHIAGQQGLYQRVITNRSNSPFNVQFQGCSPKRPLYCVAVSMSVENFLKHYIFILVLGLLLCIASGAFIYSQHIYWERKRVSVKYRVRKGLKTDRFYWLFQPIVKLDTLSIVGCEALARFEDKLGSLDPEQFIPALRDMALSKPFTEKMLKKTLKPLSEAAQIPDDFRISFNLFPQDILNKDTVQQLINLPEVAYSRFKLCLEVAEDEQLDSPVAQENLNLVSNRGLVTAIDDFGTGYSNLNQLKCLDFQILKIDRTFVLDMEQFSVRSTLIPHIVEIAQLLNLAVVAEGVENLVQRKQLEKLGVKYGQGWLFGKPMPLGQLVASIAAESRH